MYCQSLKLLTTVLVTVQLSLGSKFDPNVGSNWLIPMKSTTGASAFIPDVTTMSPSYYHSARDNQNGQSSFLATNVANTPTGLVDSSKFFYPISPQRASETGNQYHQYYQYQNQQPDENSYSFVPAVVGSPGAAEQRQEFLPIVPLGPEDGGGGSIFDGLPSIGDIFSGIGGAASSTAQAIGLGGLGVAGGALVLIVGAPLVIFAVLFPVAIMVLAILGFPVLQLTLPPQNKQLRNLKVGFAEASRKAKEVLQSEECVERVSCAIARKSRKLPYENWILKKMDNVTNAWVTRVSKAVKIGRSEEDCQRFKCGALSRLSKMVDIVKDNFTTSRGLADLD